MTRTPSSVSGKAPSNPSGKQSQAQAITDRKAKLNELAQKMNKAQGELTSAKMAQNNESSKIKGIYNAAIKKARDDQTAAQKAVTDTYTAAVKKAGDDQTAAQKTVTESFNAAQKAAGDAAAAENAKLQKGVDDANAAFDVIIKEQKTLMDEINALILQQPRGGSRRYAKKRRGRGASRR